MKQKPAYRTPDRKPGQLTGEDIHLWQRVQQTIVPLEGRQENFEKLLAELDKGKTKANSLPISQSHGLPAKPSSNRSYPAPAYSPATISPKATPSAIDDRTAKKILKGRVSIEDRIDLHGMTQDQAHRQLSEFLPRCHERGMRMVLVITGKGRTGEGILRQLVPQWLREAHLSAYVSAFRISHTSHGGEGALYVRLRRRDGQRGRK